MNINNLCTLPHNKPLRVIVGAGKQVFDGWISTQHDELNLIDRNSWKNIFRNRKIDAILSEHVWEHLSFEEGLIAARNCFEFLKVGGYIRCAVPDGNFRNKDFQNIIKIGGPGPKDHPAASHKAVYTFDKLMKIFEKAGFDVDLLEYCDANGRLHYNYWDAESGKIGRSLLFDRRNADGKLTFISIIIDAHKTRKSARRKIRAV